MVRRESSCVDTGCFDDKHGVVQLNWQAIPHGGIRKGTQSHSISMVPSPSPDQAAEEFSLLTSLRDDPYTSVAPPPLIGSVDDLYQDHPSALEEARILYSASYYMYNFHVERLLAAARDFNWPDVVDYLNTSEGLCSRFERDLMAAHLSIHKGGTWPRNVKVR